MTLEKFVLKELKMAVKAKGRGTQTEIAKHFDIKRGTVSNRLNGTRGSSETFRRTVAEIAEVDYDNIVRTYNASGSEPTDNLNTVTATNRSTVVVGDGSAGRDATNITREMTNFQLTDLELKVIKLNREYGNINFLKGFLSKLKELKKIADNMF